MVWRKGDETVKTHACHLNTLWETLQLFQTQQHVYICAAQEHPEL